ncbi:hypothetical protein HDU98_001152 [Podochytrium sp. JEL0797]|nr:hypothetical protein HDU98_001152 [Podochytrium sp. JEL0797]
MDSPRNMNVRENAFFSGAVHFMCPFPLCDDSLSPKDLLNPHQVIDHLALAHQICICNRKQVMPYLDWYLREWGAIIDEALQAQMNPDSVEFMTEQDLDHLPSESESEHSTTPISAPPTSDQMSYLYKVYEDLGIPSSTHSCDVDLYSSPPTASRKKEFRSVPTTKKLYHLGDITFERDLELRKTLHTNKLTEILASQTTLRTNPPPPRKCIFCKLTPDTQSLFFQHMHEEHSFHIGNPLNLTQIDEFFTLLENKMGNGVCIYCEGKFPDMVVLRRHMRKKKHFHVNPLNLNYDRFYVVNYADFEGRRWRDMEGEKDEPSRLLDGFTRVGGGPTPENDEDDAFEDHTGDWDDWKADLEDIGGEGTMCLFEDVMLPTVEDAVNHLKEVHGFDLKAIKKEYDLDEYGIIRLINYIRGCTAEPSCFGCRAPFETLDELAGHYQNTLHHLIMIPEKSNSFWKDVEHLFPAYDGDPLLTWDCDGDDEEDGDDEKE